MRKILMRAHMSPFYNPDFMELSTKNLIGSNIGNLLFSNSVCRTVMTEGTQVDCIKTSKDFSEDEVNQFNSEYDCFIIPLANAFRPDFMQQLDRISGLIERLNIPCVVVGVGIQGNLTGESISGYSFDDKVRRFVNCVLDKSTMLGLRGDQTAKYLAYLGYKPEKDFTVIGCPSMYIHGGKLPYFEKKEITPDSAICVNSGLANFPQLQSFMDSNLKLLNNYHFVTQVLDDMNAMYWGVPLSESKHPYIPDYYPTSFDSPIYKDGHGIGFLNVKSWMEFLSHQDFSFGTKIHGNIAAIVSGIPCYIIPPDLRVQELAQYHYIPYTPYTELSQGETIFELYDKADYGPMFAHHLENFHHYLDFLNANQVEHIYQECDFVEDCPYDEKMKGINFNEPIQAFSNVSSMEQAQRLKIYFEYTNEQRNQLQNNLNEVRNEKTKDQKKAQAEIKNLKETVDNQVKEIDSLQEQNEIRREQILSLEEEAVNRVKEIQSLEKKTGDQKKKIQDLKKETKAQKKELNHKSVQMVIKLRKDVEQTRIYKKLKRKNES